MEFFRGSSLSTLPAYADRVAAGTAPSCDLWFVDGDHSRTFPAADLENALRSASANAVVIADDCTPRFPPVQAAWRQTVAAGKVADEWNVSIALPKPAGLKGWCVGRYTGRHGFEAAHPHFRPSQAAERPPQARRPAAKGRHAVGHAASAASSLVENAEASETATASAASETGAIGEDGAHVPAGGGLQRTGGGALPWALPWALLALLVPIACACYHWWCRQLCMREKA